jgi:hypothetical protein
MAEGRISQQDNGISHHPSIWDGEELNPYVLTYRKQMNSIFIFGRHGKYCKKHYHQLQGLRLMVCTVCIKISC